MPNGMNASWQPLVEAIQPALGKNAIDPQEPWIAVSCIHRDEDDVTLQDRPPMTVARIASPGDVTGGRGAASR
jgi:hypothetical protein